MIRRGVICCCLGLCLPGAVALAQSVSLDPPRVYTGDVTRLHIELESPIPSLYAIDTEALEIDFEVLRMESRVSRITDRQQNASRMEWDLELAPRRAGHLTVPSIRLGEKNTERITLEVVERARAESAAEDVSVTLEIDPPNPYPGQQIRLILSLLHPPPMLGGRWREPGAEGAETRFSGHELQQDLQIDGKNFLRSSRSLALFAERPGPLRLSPATFVGVIPADAASDPGGLYPPGSLRRILRQSKPRQIEVRPIPANFPGEYWLPARAIELSQTWELPDNDLAVGDTLQRTLTIDAHGLPAEALPENLLAGRSESLHVYADQAVRGNRYENDVLIGRLRQSHALLLTRAGDIDLPAVTLAWWDVVSDRIRVASLPGRRIRVAATRGPGFGPMARAGDADLLATSSPPLDPLQKLALVTALLGAYLLALASTPPLSKKLRHAREISRAKRRLARACRDGNPQAARAALLDWARQRFPSGPLYGLDRLRRQLPDARLDAALTELDAALYAPGRAAWDGGKLKGIIDSLDRRPPPAPERSERPVDALYFRAGRAG